MKLKILHAADLHLDAPFSGLPPDKGAQRRQELRELPSRLTELVQAEGVQLVLLPGDLFDGDRVYPETTDALTAALGEMAVPVFIAPGNHDFIHTRSPYMTASWPDNVHIFTQPRLEAIQLPELRCTVHGCAFTTPRRESNPLLHFAAPADGLRHLLCLHGEIAESGVYAPISPSSIGTSRADYVALGHIHARQSGQENGVPWAYPGCPEGHGFDELGEKGVLLVTLDDEAPAPSLRFVPVCRRQYRVEEEFAVDGNVPLDKLKAGNGSDLLRLTFTGELTRPLNLTKAAEIYARNFFHLELRDKTTLPRDLWARSEEDTLTGLFLRNMRTRLDGADETERLELMLALRFGLAALEGGEDIRP